MLACHQQDRFNAKNESGRSKPSSTTHRTVGRNSVSQRFLLICCNRSWNCASRRRAAGKLAGQRRVCCRYRKRWQDNTGSKTSINHCWCSVHERQIGSAPTRCGCQSGCDGISFTRHDAAGYTHSVLFEPGNFVSRDTTHSRSHKGKWIDVLCALRNVDTC